MDAKTLFYRNLSSAIAKRFNTPFSTTSKPKKQVVADLLKTHFIEDNAKPNKTAKDKMSDSWQKQNNAQTIESKKINPSRAAQLEAKIKKTIDPKIESKKRMAELLLKKIELLEKTMNESSMPRYDRMRLESIISEKKKELLDMRASIS